MYSHHCCNLAGYPTIPLICGVSKGLNRFSKAFFSGPIDDCSSLFFLRPIKLSNARFLLSAAKFSGTAEPSTVNDLGSGDGKVLPWIAAYRRKGENGQVGRRNRAKLSCTSWKESADNYFRRNSDKKLRDEMDSSPGRRSLGNAESEEKVSLKVPEEVEEEVMEPSDDPRWNKIKNRYTEFTDRRTQFEKPDVYRWIKQESWGKRTWQQAEGTSVPKMVGQGVYGVGPVLAALMVARREFYALYVQEGLDLSRSKKKKDKKGVEKILEIANTIGLKVIEASKHDLNMVVDNRPHQGLVLDASPLEMVDIKGLEAAVKTHQKGPLWLALDEVIDPQNLGAITRSAYFFGIDGIVLCAKNSAPLSGVVSKASAGSLELIELRSCRNMMKFLTSSMENGWRILGGSVSSRALPLHEVECGMPTILVLGSEGRGLRPLVEKSCTQLIRIPGNISTDAITENTEANVAWKNYNCFGQELNSFLAVESLNVSVATGILLYHLVGEAKHLAMKEGHVHLCSLYRQSLRCKCFSI